MSLILVICAALGCSTTGANPPVKAETEPIAAPTKVSKDWPIAVELTIGQPIDVPSIHAQVTLLNGGFEHAIHSDGGGSMTYTGWVRFVRGDETVEHELRDDGTRTVWGHSMTISQIETVVLSISKKAD